MKKFFVSGLAIVFAVLFAVSQTPGQRGRGGAGMHGGMMMGADSSAMCPMMGMGMLPRQIVPVDDGIIVVMGNKLIKYDKNLEKKKEVTLEMDAESMRKMMEQMRQMRAMMREEMQSPAPQPKEGK